MRIAVCDDDKFCREIITELLKLYLQQNPQHDITVSAFEHADDLISASKKTGGFDLYILDILMPDTDGLELGIQLRQEGYNGMIIYLTSSEEYVLDSFKAQPFNYIIKPVSARRLFPVLDSAIDIIGYKKEKSVIVKTADGSMKLSFDSIMYAQLENRAIVYYLANGKTVESTTIRTSFADAIKGLTEDERFVVCGASYIVNLLHITASGTKDLMFRNGDSIQVPKKTLAELRSKWCEYWQNNDI